MGKRLMITATLVLGSLLFFSSSTLSGEITKVRISEAAERECLPPVNSEWGETDVTSPIQPCPISSSPGEMIGTTHYDYQTNGSTGTRIVKDYLGGLHFSWTNGIDFWSGNRWVYCNFVDETGNWLGPTPVDLGGFPQIDVISDGRADIVFHGQSQWNIVAAVERSRGSGTFRMIDVPDDGAAWPYQTVDWTDRIHVIYYTSEFPNPLYLWYTRYQSGRWTVPEIVDSLMTASAVIVSSNVSDKVAIVYTTRDPDDPDWIIDVYYIESEDGTSWNWHDKVNVTNYQPQDTIRASTDLDAVYDWNDNLHIVWNTPHRDGGVACLLWHWAQPTGITLVADGWWNSYPGAWNLTLAKMSIGVDSDDNLFTVWTQFTEEDRSILGYSNGELYMSYSTGGGFTWSYRQNLTNSPTPDCWPLECDSDHWSSLAEEVDDSLHIVYINDKDAGGIPQTEGVDTENPVLYLKVANPAAGQVTMSCENASSWFCRGGKFYFKLTVANTTGSSVSGRLRFTGYSDYDCDPANSLVSILRDRTYPRGVTIQYYFFKVPNGAGPGPYSASIGGTLSGYDLFCCMNTDIVQCGPWKMGSNTEWELVEVERPEVQTAQPMVTSLLQNYPNPFNATTEISYRLATDGPVKLEIYNLLGEKTETLINEYQTAGERSIIWDASRFSSGIYFCRLTAVDLTQVRRMTLLR
jgi:hypothetical protein